ncbi:hypothetical protein J6590_050968 [Homalodisca vitripennis]|nr:hypothetical protein J6590_050968 [Homalodisca vitripennis]
MISIASGSLLMYAVGPFVSYELIHYILLGICAVFFMLFPLLPNSPYALVMNNQVNSARKTLTWLREKRSTSCVEKELQDIQKVVTKNETDSAGSIKDLFTSRGNRRALTVCCTLISLQQLSGITVVLFYVQQIFHATASTISSSTCSIIIGLVKLAAGFVCPVAVKSFGYKTPMIVSTFGSALGVGGLGVFFFLKNHGFNVDSLNWLPLLSVVLYMFAFISAFATVPWALSGELFPGSVKPKATTIITMTKAFMSFLTAKMFPHLSRLLGIDSLFLGFSLFCCLSMVFVTVAVRDTSGMSFMEIQEMLNGHKKKEILLVQEK